MASPEDLNIGDFVRWKSSGGMARGQVRRVIRNGQINVAKQGITVTATEDNPAAVIKVWKKKGNGYEPTKRVVAHRFAGLSKTKALRIADDSEFKSSKDSVTRVSAIKSINDEKRIVYGLVYEPNVLDSHGEFMTAEEIEKMAHKFMELDDLGKTIDRNHDRIAVNAHPIESYIAKAGDPDYREGSWVLGVKIYDEAIWNDIKTGKIGGYSWEAYVRKSLAKVEYEWVRNSFGKTESYEDHDHLFFAEFDEDGRVVKGRTSTDAGHSHEILFGTTTEASGKDGHKHRFFVE